MNKIEKIRAKKGKGKITMLTCYDYSFSRVLEEAGIDIILVGDSLANVVLGLDDTRQVSAEEMFNHTRAVCEAAKKTPVVADMPYATYQKDTDKCLRNAEKFMEMGADAVKVEWFKDCPAVVDILVKAGIPVMGHIGLTPQTVHLLGGYRVQGKDEPSASRIKEQAKILEDKGSFSLVLECIPSQLASAITGELKIPTIGIGAGRFCDGQVLVLYDIIGLYRDKKPRFVRAYMNLSRELEEAVLKFKEDVEKGVFPSPEESYR
ncbi:MAG: 3-methyl-2-oxobutanoate hydroxymethyltransferase [Candidatus Omnitrophica bacterium]|nr:3-methyl-2-oxobutanoate hydroxymethyltransferase [Candidatus Omnitrophota bacterium]MBD3269609.1 3-methyl-2-oxobutanoate hydroxymethyltransferase [Candidatus Omnitrophota bacterium]